MCFPTLCKCLKVQLCFVIVEKSIISSFVHAGKYLILLRVKESFRNDIQT